MSALAKTVILDMGTVHESDLRKYCEQKAVTHMRIVRTKTKGRGSEAERFGYELYVQLSWKEQEDLLITYNSKRPRTWANLDRMTQHIDSEYGFTGTIFLQL